MSDSKETEGAAGLGRILALLAAIALATVSASLLTPPLYAFLGSLFESQPWPYSRVFDRVILLTLVVSLYIFRKRLFLSDILAQLRFSVFKRDARLFVAFLLLSFLSSFSLLWLFYYDGTLVFSQKPSSYLLRKSIETPLAALIISVLEEGVFRLAFFLTLKPRLGFWPAAFFTSALYSAVHFIRPVKSFELQSASSLEGISYLGVLFERVVQDGFWLGFIGLLMVGIALCIALDRNKSVWAAIGLHAGWILTMKFQTYVFSAAPGVEFPAALGKRYFLIAEPIGWLSIFIVIVLVSRIRFSPKNTE